MEKISILRKSFKVIITIFIFTAYCLGKERVRDSKIPDEAKSSILLELETKTLKELEKYLGKDKQNVKEALLIRLDDFKAKEDIPEKVKILYALYIQEETEENNKIKYIGGQGPPHLQIQIKVLLKLKELPLEHTKEKIIDIVNKFLNSVEKMDYQKWRFSPKQGLQIYIGSLLGTHIKDEDIEKMASRFISSKQIKEYAKAYLVIPLLEYKVSKIPEEEDKDCSKRIKIILEIAKDPQFFSPDFKSFEIEPGLLSMLHAPKRFYGCAEIMRKVLKNDITKIEAFVDNHPKLDQEERYFLYFFIGRSLLEKLNKNLKSSNKEKKLFKEVADFWIEIYPTIAKQKYFSDPLGKVVDEIAEKINDKNLKKTIKNVKSTYNSKINESKK